MKRSLIISSAIATFSIAKQEDFGVEVAESLACGVPVIVNRVGGHKELIENGTIWIFLPDDFTVSHIMETTESMTKERSLIMKDACVEKARIFALDDFALRMQDYFVNDEMKEEIEGIRPEIPPSEVSQTKVPIHTEKVA